MLHERLELETVEKWLSPNLGYTHEPIKNPQQNLYRGWRNAPALHKGIFINTCYEQLCLTNPDLIESVHRDYVEAGADLIETNTFGANRLKLEAHMQINSKRSTAAIHITRKVAGPDTFILGSVGLTPIRPTFQ